MYLVAILSTTCLTWYDGEFVRNGARPKRRPDLSRRAAHEEMKADQLHKDLADFEEYKEQLLPAIRRDLKAGLTAKQIREKYVAYLQAKMIARGIMTDDASQSIAIAKDVIDRVEGKATEKKEVSHRFADMSDKELDAILKSEEEELEAMSERFDQ